MRKQIPSLSCALAVFLVALLVACSNAPSNSAAIPTDTSAPLADAVSALLSPAPQDTARAAVVDDFAGHVIATSGGDELSAFRGLALLRRDSLETSAESWSSLELGEGQFVLVEENSKVSIAQLADDAKSAELTMIGGKIWVEIAQELADDESFEIRTPTCALSVRGTVFSVVYDESSCRVAVYAGTVLLHAEDESGSPILDESGNEVFLEISGDKAVVTVEDGIVTHALQTVLTQEDWMPLHTQGGAESGDVFDILRGRLPELVWDEDSSPFAAHAYYARMLRAFLDSGESGYSVMLRDIDCDGVEELAIYWEDIVFVSDEEYGDRVYRLDIYDWDNGEELHFAQEKTEIYQELWEHTIFLSDKGYLAFYTHGSDISPCPGWVYDHSRRYTIEGGSSEAIITIAPSFDGSEVTEERFAQLCSEYGLELINYEDEYMKIVSYESGEPAFPYADTQKDIRRLLPDYAAP